MCETNQGLFLKEMITTETIWREYRRRTDGGGLMDRGLISHGEVTWKKPNSEHACAICCIIISSGTFDDKSITGTFNWSVAFDMVTQWVATANLLIILKFIFRTKYNYLSTKKVMQYLVSPSAVILQSVIIC